MPGAEYWIEISNYLAEEDYFGPAFDRVGVAFLERGPVTVNTTYFKVRDPVAPEELQDKTVDLTFGRTLTNLLTDDQMDELPDEEIRAWEPEYKHEIIERRAR